MSLSAELSGFAGFLRGLPAFLRYRITPDQAREAVVRRIRERESNFLALAERAIFGNPKSPYRSLLRLAGCELGDLRRMLHADGLDNTLRVLRMAGVYVSFEEFKGLRPIERGGRIIPAVPEDFDNPFLTNYHHVGTGGSTGASRRVLMDLDHLTARLPMILLGDMFHGLAGIPNAFWFEIPPGNGLDSVLTRVPVGNAPERWFSPIRGGRDGAGLRFRVATQATVALARATGNRIPSPEYVPLDQARVIAHWAAEALQRRGACAIRAHVSKALRICIAARAEGIDLTGTVICSGGEPPTAAKVAQIRSMGVKFYSNYYFTEAGAVGMSCTTSEDPNDQHFFQDHLALIQASREVTGFDMTVSSFHFTTLLPSAPKVLLNVESDDYGVVESRKCGCPFEHLGFSTHVRDIRSFRKLTGEGVTLVGSDMERILEETLPRRFGGTSLDYQIVEEEDEAGFTRLTIIMHPALGFADEQSVVRTVLASLPKSGPAAEMSGSLWSQAHTFRVRREVPRVTSRGKWMPLRVARGSVTSDRAVSSSERIA